MNSLTKAPVVVLQIIFVSRLENGQTRIQLTREDEDVYLKVSYKETLKVSNTLHDVSDI